jgi:hypothetical protein
VTFSACLMLSSVGDSDGLKRSHNPPPIPEHVVAECFQTGCFAGLIDELENAKKLLTDWGVRFIRKIVEVVGDLGRCPSLGDIQKVGEQVAIGVLGDSDTDAILVVANR